MPALRTLSLLWEHRFRSAYPLTPRALANDGSLLLASPHPTQARTYQILRIRSDSQGELLDQFSSEILHKLDLKANANAFLGLTSDDLYLFVEGEKRRFLPEKRVVYIDADMDGPNARFAALYADFSGQNYALTYGTLSGKVLWSLELESAANAVTLFQRGQNIVVAHETGLLLALDAGMRELWRFETENPLSHLVASEEGDLLLFGAKTGRVGLLESDGTLRWMAELPGPVYALSLSNGGERVALLCGTQEVNVPTHLLLLDAQGQPAWEYENEVPYTGLACSPNGEYVATSAQGSRFALYQVVSSQVSLANLASPTSWQVQLQVLSEENGTANNQDNRKQSLLCLQQALQADPADIACWEQFQKMRSEWNAQQSRRLAELLHEERWREALELLEAQIVFNPMDIGLFQQAIELRHRFANHLLEQARALLTHGAQQEAEAHLLEALQLVPELTEARQLLHSQRTAAADAAQREAEQALASGDTEKALYHLERAQSLDQTAQRAQQIALLQTKLDYEIGKQAYDEGRYPQAIFQFRKVLQRDPEHAEAKRYLRFAQRFVQDAAADTLSDRFRSLEE